MINLFDEETKIDPREEAGRKNTATLKAETSYNSERKKPMVHFNFYRTFSPNFIKGITYCIQLYAELELAVRTSHYTRALLKSGNLLTVTSKISEGDLNNKVTECKKIMSKILKDIFNAMTGDFIVNNGVAETRDVLVGLINSAEYEKRLSVLEDLNFDDMIKNPSNYKNEIHKLLGWDEILNYAKNYKNPFMSFRSNKFTPKALEEMERFINRKREDQTEEIKIENKETELNNRLQEEGVTRLIINPVGHRHYMTPKEKYESNLKKLKIMSHDVNPHMNNKSIAAIKYADKKW